MYEEFIRYLSDLIDDIGNIVIDSNKYTYKETATRLSLILLRPKYRIHLGILLVFISMFLYVIDVTNY